MGAVSVVDAKGRLVGYFTDGDVRRLLPKDTRLLRRKISDVMTPNPIRIRPDQTAAEAGRLLGRRRIDNMPVVDPVTQKPVGVIDEKDILSAGLK